MSTMSLEQADWSNLLMDPLACHSNFAFVCQNCNAVHQLYCIEQTDPHPLLIHVKISENGMVNYYSPVWNKTFKVKSTLASSKSRFFSMKVGWLVMYKKVVEGEDEVEVVLANPATNVSYSYPGLRSDHFFTGITFSGCPGTKDFVIFGITSQEWKDGSVNICLWKEGRWKLQFAHYDNQSNFFMSSFSSPVLYKDSFYCVSGNGELGVFNPEDETWNVLANPKGFPEPPSSKEVYLIESKHEIMAVVGGNHDPLVSLVFHLDCEKMAWKKTKCLDTRSVFIGSKACIMIDLKKEENDERNEEEGTEEVDIKSKGKDEKKLDAIGGAMKNRVYTTRFYGNIDVVEAEMKTCEGRLFFITKACDHGKNKDESKTGNILSYGLESCKENKYYGSSQYLYSAWYKPEVVQRLVE